MLFVTKIKESILFYVDIGAKLKHILHTKYKNIDKYLKYK